jgi:hypothetical protein
MRGGRCNSGEGGARATFCAQVNNSGSGEDSEMLLAQ